VVVPGPDEIEDRVTSNRLDELPRRECCRRKLSKRTRRDMVAYVTGHNAGAPLTRRPGAGASDYASTILRDQRTRSKTATAPSVFPSRAAISLVAVLKTSASEGSALAPVFRQAFRAPDASCIPSGREKKQHWRSSCWQPAKLIKGRLLLCRHRRPPTIRGSPTASERREPRRAVNQSLFGNLHTSRTGHDRRAESSIRQDRFKVDSGKMCRPR